MLLTIVVGCKKNDRLSINLAKQDIISVNAKVVNKHVSFKSTKDFRAFFDLAPETRKIMTKNLESEFTSMRQYRLSRRNTVQRMIKGCDVPDDVIDDNDEFFSLLDSNCIIQVGDDLFRYDYCNEMMYVISNAASSDDSKYYNFMTGNTSDTNVRWFPSYVDGLEALDSGYRTMPDTSTVAESEIFSRSVGNTKYEEYKHFRDVDDKGSTTRNTQVYAKLAYDKFFFYFHFYGKEKYQRPFPLFQFMTVSYGTRDWRTEYSYQYLRKKSTTNYSGSGTEYPPLSRENKLEKTFYGGSKALQRIYVRWDVFNYTDVISVNRGENGYYIGDYISYPGVTYLSNYDFNYQHNTYAVSTSYLIVNNGY